jgi:superfamily II DNA or RNA helicase
LLSIYNDILAEANSTKLFNWNVNAFADLVNFLRDNQSALVYICTGGGKTTTALEYLRLFGGKALVLGPGETIKSGWEDEKNWKDLGTTADVVNYQTFMNDYKTRDLSKYSVVICDEAHHLGAERWGEGIRWILENKPEIKIIGLTATPTKEQFEGTDTEFGGRVCYGLDLATGIKEKNIWPFSYISSIYKMEDVKDEFEKYGTEGRILWDRLNIKLNETPVTEILHRHMPEGQRKIIVFCSSIKDIPYAEEVMNKYDPTLECKVITSKQDTKQNNTAKKWFNDTTDKNVCLITVSMVNEGAHYDGVNTLIMFRRTHSATLYLQQLGRVVVTTQKPNPNGIVFDFTNNAENLIYNSAVQVEITSDDISDTEVTEDEKKEIIGSVKRAIQECSGKEVIYEDYTEDCVATLNTLKEAQNVNKQSAVIYSAFDDLKKVLETEEQDFFYYDLWANLETAAGNLSITRPKHATSKKTSDTFDEALAGKRSVTRKVVKASEVEKLATAFRTAIRRLYNFGYIEFADMRSFDITILNKSKFNTTIKTLGFKNAKLFEDVMNKLNKHSLIIASNI